MWCLGDLDESERAAYQTLELAKAMNEEESTAAHLLIGLVHLGNRDWESARASFQEAEQIEHEAHQSGAETYGNSLLGCVALARGDRAEAASRFQKAIESCQTKFLVWYPMDLAFLLSALEAAYQASSAFRTFGDRYREEHPGIKESSLVQWYLEPADVEAQHAAPLREDFADSLATGWVWLDPFGDCSFRVQDGLEIHAANGRDLWSINRSAPRVMMDRPLGGDFTIQTACLPAMDDRPGIGGLLLWQDRENYLRLDRDALGKDQVILAGDVANRSTVIGRGLLPVGASGCLFLRLERRGAQVRAYCSADGGAGSSVAGAHWLTVGQVEFPVTGSIQVGLHAIGAIDRAVYHGAYPEGSAIRFRSFELWETEPT